MRFLLRALLTALAAVIGLADFCFDVFLRSLCGGRVPGEDEMQPTAADLHDPHADDREGVVEIKRWSAALIDGRTHYPPTGKYRKWLVALNEDVARLIGQAALSGKLQSHLDGSRLIPGVPPVAGYDETRSWMRQNHVPPPRVMEIEDEPAYALSR